MARTGNGYTQNLVVRHRPDFIDTLRQLADIREQNVSDEAREALEAHIEKYRELLAK